MLVERAQQDGSNVGNFSDADFGIELRYEVATVAEHKKTILLVDDDPDNVEFLRRTFCEHFRILMAYDGEVALDLLRENDVDVIVTDQRMPNLAGTGLLECSLEINPNIIRIILSAYTDTTDLLDAINVCRIHNYVVKPVPAAKLREIVWYALSLRDAGR